MKRILLSMVFISLLLMACEGQHSVQEAAFIKAAKGHTEVVKLLLEAKAEINTKSNLAGINDTPLSNVQRMGHTQIIELLEKAGAKNNVVANTTELDVFIA